MDRRSSHEVIPSHEIIPSHEVIPKQQTNSYELSSKYNNIDKSTGNYSRYSVAEKVTENQRHVESGSRREGVRDEYKTTENLKVGNDNGYTEHIRQETYRYVTLDNNTSCGKKNDCDDSAGVDSDSVDSDGDDSNGCGYSRGGDGYGSCDGNSYADDFDCDDFDCDDYDDEY